MRHEHGSDLMTERENYSLEHQSSAGLAEYIFIPHTRDMARLFGRPSCLPRLCQSFEKPATKAPSRTRTSRSEPFNHLFTLLQYDTDLLLPAAANFSNSIIVRRKGNGRC